MDKIDPTIKRIPLPKKGGQGRKATYNFWDIPVDPEQCRVFEDTDMHKLSAAMYQFRKSYGGQFTSRTLEDGSVAVWCLEAPSRVKK